MRPEMIGLLSVLAMFAGVAIGATASTWSGWRLAAWLERRRQRKERSKGWTCPTCCRHNPVGRKLCWNGCGRKR